MNAELEEFKKQMVKKARKTATVFGILAIIMMISCEYAFFQQEVNDRERKEVERLNVELMEIQQRLQTAESKTASIQKHLEQALMDARKARESVENVSVLSNKTK